MNRRYERQILIGLLVFSYATRAPDLIRQGVIGLPALVIGLLFSGVLVLLLLRSSANAALIIAVIGAIGGVVAPIVQMLVLPLISRAPRPPVLEVALSATTSLLAAVCAMNLWSEWRKRHNKAPEPTTMAVTIRAEPRLAPATVVAHL